MVDSFVLRNGLRVFVERMPQLRSVSIGVWVKAGSMLETPQENGLSHLIEHMAFKGTSMRTAKELAEEMDAIGGQMNAATSKLYTSYYAKVCETDLVKAVDLLADITLNPLTEEADLEKEKNVVLEEIAMGEDSPEDQAWDLMNEALYKGHSLSLPIIGDKEKISGYTREQVLAFRKKYYQPANAVLSIAGRVHVDELRDMLEEKFGQWHGDLQSQYPANAVSPETIKLALDKKTEQVQLCIGYPGLDMDNREVFTLSVLNTILGGGVSSRLFQRIREEQGLVYSIYSSPTFYPGCGDFVISAASTPIGARKVLGQVQQEIDRFMADGATEKELIQAKAQLRTGLVLSQESAYARMSRTGSSQLIRNKQRTIGQILRSIDAITGERVMRLAKKTFGQAPSIAVVGRNAQRFLK